MRRQPLTLSGRQIHCAIWVPDGSVGYKCGNYARACNVPKCANPADPQSKQARVCVKMQSVFSLFYDKEVRRCKRYLTSCVGYACMDAPMPYPKAEPERLDPSQAEVKSVATWMAQEFNAEHFGKEGAEGKKYLAREVLSRGGIRSYRKGAQSEEYLSIPLFMRNRQGLPLDEMASEMGYKYENDLIAAIATQYPPKAKGEWKKAQKRKTWEDFENDAYTMIESRMADRTWT